MNHNDSDRSAVIRNERLWHEQEAQRRYSLDTLLYAPPAFDAVVDSAFDFLDGRTGELVLDMGCGEGKELVNWAARGLVVVGMDLSHNQLRRARELVGANAPEARVLLVQANAEEPPFTDARFRIIYGKAILHHLEPVLAGRIVNRLLQPGGQASFAEPLARHPMIWLGRRITPKLRTKDEHPLFLHELEAFGRLFQAFDVRAFYLLSPIAYFFRLLPAGEKFFRWAHSFLSRLDLFFFSRLRRSRKFAWYGRVNVQK